MYTIVWFPTTIIIGPLSCVYYAVCPFLMLQRILHFSKFFSLCLTGRGVPNNLAIECNNITAIPSRVLPSTYDATQMYLTQGGTLVQFGLFGCDPLRDRADLIHRREVYLFSNHPTFNDMFSNVVSGDGALFSQAIIDFIRVTKSLQHLV